MMSSVLFLFLEIVADHYAVVHVLFSKHFTNSEWGISLDTLPIIQAVIFHVVGVVLKLFYWSLVLWWFVFVWGLGFFYV